MKIAQGLLLFIVMVVGLCFAQTKKPLPTAPSSAQNVADHRPNVVPVPLTELSEALVRQEMELFECQAAYIKELTNRQRNEIAAFGVPWERETTTLQDVLRQHEQEFKTASDVLRQSQALLEAAHHIHSDIANLRKIMRTTNGRDAKFRPKVGDKL